MAGAQGSAVAIAVCEAGGIADSRGVAAAMMLGASGVQLGTAYLFCPEAGTSAVHRAPLKSDAARAIVTRLVHEIGPLNPAAPAFPLAAAAILPLRQKAESLGRNDFSSLWAGANAPLCRERPAADLTRELGAA